MIVGIYTNKSKDVGGIWSNKLHSLLNRKDIEYVDIFDGNFSAVNPVKDMPREKLDVIIVLGGDGTILGLTTYASENDIPIIGINAGKLGFLTEFETFEMESAVELIKSDKLKPDERILLQIEIGERCYFALNDCVLQRIYSEENMGSQVIGLSVSLDDTLVDKISGDGLIISTPTGSTAYSLSAGGSAATSNGEACTPLIRNCKLPFAIEILLVFGSTHTRGNAKRLVKSKPSIERSTCSFEGYTSWRSFSRTTAEAWTVTSPSRLCPGVKAISRMSSARRGITRVS